MFGIALKETIDAVGGVCYLRYKDNERVYYELVNEPRWGIEKYLDPVFKENLLEIYRRVRADAPTRTVLMFSFHQNGYEMERAIDASWVDWKSWSDTSFDKVNERLLPDATAKGYAWWESSR